MLLLIAILPGSLCSCMLLFQGTTEEIHVESEPSGATATLGNGETRVTPFSLTVPREQDLQIHFSKPGYQSRDIDDDSNIEAAAVIDMLPLMFPWAVDESTGAGYAHQQPSVVVHLDPVATAEAATDEKAAAPVPQPTPSVSSQPK